MIESLQPGTADNEPGEPAAGLGQRSGGNLGARTDQQTTRRLWLLAMCVLLTVLAFSTSPGKIIADTKIDMAVDPARFMLRSLHLWDPAQFGQLQDQAAGYFFPMGPFFELGKLALLPGWVTQRLWMSAIDCAAFLGVVRLSRRFGIGSDGSRLIAGLAYALSPAALGLLGILSSEYLPAAMLPWILLPLVRAVQEHAGVLGMLRAAAQSAVAVALCGGINAAAVAAVLLPPAIYLVTAPRPAKRLLSLAIWLAVVLLACLWWIIPLLLLSKYGVSFLPYTESAATTTYVASLINALRGTENWVTYIIVDGKPWWPAGFAISTTVLPTLLTGVVSGLGLAGLLRLRRPERRFLVCVLVAGLLLIVSGHVYVLGDPLAGRVDQLINGPLGSLRNVRKFDPLVRLPLSLGLAGLLSALRMSSLRVRGKQLQAAVGGLAAVSVAGVALSAAVTGLSTPGAFAGFPAYWVSAASWLNAHAGNQAVLAEPGARFGQYVWGQPMDDVLEALSTGNWASMQLSSIGSVGNERLLQAIDEQISAGDGSGGLSQVLARIGVKYIVVRNDLIRTDLRGAWPARVHEALANSAGIRLVAQFGKVRSGSGRTNAAALSRDTGYPPVQIYQVSGAQPAAEVVGAGQTMRVYGGPEALLELASAGLLRNRPVVLNSDHAGVPVRETVLTDLLRKRVRHFGEIRADYSQTLTASAHYVTSEAANDYIKPTWLRYLATARYSGIASVTALSSASDINVNAARSATGLLPFAAIDGNLTTMWESSGTTSPIGQWIRIDFTRKVYLHRLRVAFAHSPAIGPPVSQVTVRTATGRRVDKVANTGQYQFLRVPHGRSSWLRIKVDATTRKPRGMRRQVGIAEISVPGIRASRTIVAPAIHLAGGKDPSAVVLAKAEPAWSGCIPTSLRWVCSASQVKRTEEQYGFNEGFKASSGETATLTGSAVLTNVGLISKYVWPSARHAYVTASSTYITAPQDTPDSAFDGNPLTSWISSYTDKRPWLTITWGKPKLISHIDIERPPNASQIAQVYITGSDGQVRGGVIAASGLLRFAPLRTSKLTLRFEPSRLPIEVAEVGIPGVTPLTAVPNAPLRLKCGLGPLMTVNGVPVPTKASGTIGDLLTGQPLRYQACSTVDIAAGFNKLVEPAADSFDLQSAVLDAPGSHSLAAGPLAVSEPVTTLKWTPSARAVRVSVAKTSYLVVNENYNGAWQAKLGNRLLRPVQLDGWRQAWLLPGGSNGVVALTFVPDSLYRIGLLGGLGLLALVCLLAVLVSAAMRRRARRTKAAGGPGSSDTPVLGNGLAADGNTSGNQAPGAMSPQTRRPVASHAMAAAVVPASYVLLSLVGLALGGYLGAVILPAATGLFVLLFRGASTNRTCAELTRPRIICGLLVVAAASTATAEKLWTVHGVPVKLLGSIGPQLLCLIIVARLAAALVGRERSAEPDPYSATVTTASLQPTPLQPTATPDDGSGAPLDQNVAGDA